jgi:hypothetical protein
LANKLLRDISGSVLVEATLTIPLMLLLALGTVDVAYMFFDWTLANKAAYVGARTAVVSNPVASTITTVNYTSAELQNIGQFCFDTGGNNINCPTQSSTCTPDATNSGTCTNCTGSCKFDDTAFLPIFNRMRAVFPRLQRQNVQISYQTNGLGFVGENASSGGLPMSVTVSITGIGTANMTHQFFFAPGLVRFAPLFGGSISATPSIPNFSTTLQSEDMFTN